MNLQINNPLNINGAHFYLLLYEIFETGMGKRVHPIAACRMFVNSPVNLLIEILTDIPQSTFIEQAHDYIHTFTAETVYEATLLQAAQFFNEKHIALATELLYNTINAFTPPGLYVDYSFYFDTWEDRAMQECTPSALV